MYTFIDECPVCRVEGARVEFTWEEGCAATHLQPGEGSGPSDIRCCSCGERLDDHEDVVEACRDAAEAEIEHERYPDL